MDVYVGVRRYWCALENSVSVRWTLDLLVFRTRNDDRQTKCSHHLCRAHLDGLAARAARLSAAGQTLDREQVLNEYHDDGTERAQYNYHSY